MRGDWIHLKKSISINNYNIFTKISLKNIYKNYKKLKYIFVVVVVVVGIFVDSAFRIPKWESSQLSRRMKT